MALAVFHSGASNKAYVAFVLRLDTKKWLDPLDPSGLTWLDNLPESGWQLEAIISDLTHPYSKYYLTIIPTPEQSWPDGVPIGIFIHEQNVNIPEAYELTTVYQQTLPTNFWQTGSVFQSSSGSLGSVSAFSSST